MRGFRLAAVLVVVAVGVFGSGVIGTASADAPTCAGDGSDFDGGDGSEGNPYQIVDVEELQCVGGDAHLDSHFVLIRDVDASDTQNWDGGFEPIGDDSTEFSGAFDGGGNTISGLKIDTSDEFVGLFAQTGDGAVIENVIVSNADVDGNQYVGGLVGYNSGGTVQNAHVSGEVEGAGSVGAAIGYNSAEANNLSVDAMVTVQDTSSGSNVVGGGVVGQNYNGMLADSYATGSVNSADVVGGVVGNNFGTVRRTYAAASVKSDRGLGSGVVGFNDGTLEDIYWDREATGQDHSDGGGIRLSTEEMTGADAPENMDQLGFTDTWHASNGYPVLAWENDDSYFAVTIKNTNSPIEVDDTLTVTASVTNWGADGSGTVTLTDTDFGGKERDSTDVTLGSEETNNAVDLSWTTDSQDAGAGAITVSSGDDEATETVSVADPVLSLDIDESEPINPVDSGSANEITVTATYEDAGTGDPIEDEPVLFSTDQAEGSLTDRDGSTNGDGETTAIYVVGDGDWNQDVELSVELDDDSTVSDSAAFGVEEPGFAVNVKSNVDEIQPSGEVDVTATVTYEEPFADGNPREGETVDFSAGNADGSLETTDDTNADGEATTTYTPGEGDFGDQVTITGSVGGVTDTTTVDVLDTLKIEATDSTTTAGESGELEVMATDGDDVPLEGVSIEVTDDGGLDGISTGETSETDASGVTTFSFNEEQSGEATLSFAWVENTDAEDTATVRVDPAEADGLTFAKQPTDSTAGESITDEDGGSITVDIRDEYDNVVDDASDEVVLDVETGDGTLNGETAVDADEGIAKFSDISIETADDYTLDASTEELSETSSSSFTVSAAHANTVIVNAEPESSQTAGESITGQPAAGVTDEFGNPVDNVDVAVEAVGGTGDTTAGSTTNRTDTSGVTVFDDLEIETVGEYSLRFKIDGDNSGVDTGDTTMTDVFDVDPAALNALNATNVTETAGITGRVAVNASDAFDNRIIDEEITISDTGSLGGLTLGETNQTNETGDATFEFIENRSGTYTVELAAVDDSTVNTTANVTIKHAAFDSLSVSLNEDSLTRGDSTTLTANATYVNGTTLDRTETATLTSNDSSIASVDANGTVRAEGVGSADLEAELAGETDTIAVSVSNPPRSSSTRAPPRDNDGDSDEADVDIETNADGSVSARIVASADEPATVYFGNSIRDEESGTRYGRVNLTFSEDTDVAFEARSTNRDDLPEATPPLGSNEEDSSTDSESDRGISYVELTVSSDGVDASDRVRSATVEFDVSTDALDARNLTADDIALNRYDEDAGEWTELETEVVWEGDEQVTYESATPGFSMFAVGKRATEMDSTNESTETESTNESTDSQSTTKSTETDPTTESTETGGDVPGFGLLAGMVALLALALLVRQRN